MEALRLWKNLQMKAEPVETFVTQAEDVLTTQAETPMETLQSHKVKLCILCWKTFTAGKGYSANL